MRMRSSLNFVLPLVLVLGLALPASAQRTSANLRGTITDASGFRHSDSRLRSSSSPRDVW